MAALTGALGAVLDDLAAARGAAMPWAPVLFSVGIAAFFLARQEPGQGAFLQAGAGLAAAMALRVRGGERWQLPAMGAALILAGFLVAGLRTQIVA
ncbi:MAG: competence protein, partial [Rhodobacteraceae bacterium]|nr:competence protein [Paracoccaceae bacterium]